MVDDELTPEEEEHLRRVQQMTMRYPTFLLLTKVLVRHRRLNRLRGLKAPQPILDRENQMREEALDALAEAFPYNSEEGGQLSLADILNTLVGELNHPHGNGGTDA